MQWIQHSEQTSILDSALCILVFTDIWHTRDPRWANRNGLWGICSLLDWQLLPNQKTMEHLKWHQRPILTELNCTFTALIMKLWRPPISEHPPENAGPWLRKQYAFWCWTRLSNRYRYGPCRVILLLFSQFTGMLIDLNPHQPENKRPEMGPKEKLFSKKLMTQMFTRWRHNSCTLPFVNTCSVNPYPIS